MGILNQVVPQLPPDGRNLPIGTIHTLRQHFLGVGKVIWFVKLKRDVNVVLVSLLADQLSGQFLIILVSQKKVSSLRDRTIYFWSSLDIRE